MAAKVFAFFCSPCSLGDRCYSVHFTSDRCSSNYYSPILPAGYCYSSHTPVRAVLCTTPGVGIRYLSPIRRAHSTITCHRSAAMPSTSCSTEHNCSSAPTTNVGEPRCYPAAKHVQPTGSSAPHHRFRLLATTTITAKHV